MVPAVRGFSVLETVFSLGILAVALVSLVGFFTITLDSSARGANMTAGAAFAQQRLEEAIRENLYWPVPERASEGIYTMDASSQTRFFHQLSTTPLPASSPDYRGGYRVEVTVWWWTEQAGQSRQGQGTLTTRAALFHYPDGVSVTGASP